MDLRNVDALGFEFASFMTFSLKFDSQSMKSIAVSCLCVYDYELYMYSERYLFALESIKNQTDVYAKPANW